MAELSSAVSTIHIVDDHPLIREALSALISNEPDLQVCCTSANADEAMQALRRQRPDLSIVDLSLRDSHGLDLIRRIKAFDPSIRVLVLTQWDASMYAGAALRRGADGYLEKFESPARTLEAIRRALRREPSELAGMRPPSSAGTRAGWHTDALSTRERQVFQLLGEGRTTREIAEMLALSPHTIETHRSNIKAKLELRSNNALIRAAVGWVGSAGRDDGDA